MAKGLGLNKIPITDLARTAQASGIRYIGFRHESDAVHAAAAGFFLTKKPGLCLTVSGPGFLNGLVALANATTNCFPVVQISGSSDRHIVDLKRGDYEELDQIAAADRFAKAAYRVGRAEDIGRGIALSSTSPGSQLVALRELMREPMVFVCESSHPLADRKAVRLTDLAGHDFINFPLGWGIRQRLDTGFAAADAHPVSAYEVADYAIAAGLIRRRLATTILPTSVAGRFPDLCTVR